MLSSCFPSFFSRDQAKAYDQLAQKQRSMDEKESVRQMMMRSRDKIVSSCPASETASGATLTDRASGVRLGAKRVFADLTNTVASPDGSGSSLKKARFLRSSSTVSAMPSAVEKGASVQKAAAAEHARRMKRKNKKKQAALRQLRKDATKRMLALKERVSKRSLRMLTRTKSEGLKDNEEWEGEEEEEDARSVRQETAEGMDASGSDHHDDEAEDECSTIDDSMEQDIKRQKDAVRVAEDGLKDGAHMHEAELSVMEEAENGAVAEEGEHRDGGEVEDMDEERSSWMLEHGIDDIDKEDADDPENCAVYAQEIYEHLHARQLMNRPSSTYLTDTQQSELTERMRALTINWMVEASDRFSLLPETLFLSVNLFDRFLSLKQVGPRRIQLIAIACMYLASKYEEIHYPTLKDFEWLSNKTCSAREIVKAEAIIVAALKFDLTTVNPFHFIRRFSKASRSSRRTHTLTKYVMELSLSEYAVLRFKASVVAAACVYIARAMTRHSPVWNPTLEHFTRCAEDDSADGRDAGLMDCVRMINELVWVAYEDKVNPRTVAPRKKYATVQQHSVALITPVHI